MKIWLVAAMMALSVYGAYALAPDRLVAGAGTSPALEEMVPAQFGEWRVDDSFRPVLPREEDDEDDDSLAARIYDRTLVRTYRNGDDERIMLVIAYGSDQSDALQVHMPEVCYASQGFAVSKSGRAVIETGETAFPVIRLTTRRGRRHEPVTYWMRVGDRVVTSVLSRQWAKLVYGLRGRIPDGVLVRVSSISTRPEHAFLTQERFVRELIRSVDPRHRDFLLGERTA
ncbi:MAG: exosortase-associated protein EpsI, B-type [Alphaproteobacteria bacterium]